MTDKVIMKFYWSKACFPGYDQVTDEFRNPKHSMYDIEWAVMMGSIQPWPGSPEKRGLNKI